MSIRSIFIGWHKKCGGKVSRTSAGSVVQMLKCDKCAATSLNGSLNASQTTTDPYDSSVQQELADIIEGDMNSNLKHF